MACRASPGQVTKRLRRLQSAPVRADDADEAQSTGGGTMSGRRSEAEEQVADLLQTARKALRLQVAFLSRLDETTQHYEVWESDTPGLEAGFSFPRHETFCQAVLDGRLPLVMPD